MLKLELLHNWACEHDIEKGALSRVTSAIESGGFTLPGLNIRPFYDSGSFTWTGEASSHTARMTQEFQQLKDRLMPHPESETLVTRGFWQAFFLWRGGCRRTANSHIAPTGTQVTGLAPGGGQAGNSYFSALGPGTEIRAHTGRFNARLRCHVGLLIPDGVWIEVAGERNRWRPGECLIFSDALPHHVINDGIDTRTVFAFDFWHPDVTPVERAALSMLLASGQ